MNVFRLAGDLSHLLAIIILLLKIWRTRSCAGISGKSQILFAFVYTTRYLDLVTTYISAYNSVMKVVFIGASYATVYFMYIKFKATYDHNHDTFRIEFLIIPAALLSLLINHDFSVLEILWTFSIYLESVAILPQLFLVSKTGEAESITSHYLFALGSYRALYLLNWVYRYMVESHYDLIAIVAGAVQTVLYCDFFYLYITKVVLRKKGECVEEEKCLEEPALQWTPLPIAIWNKDHERKVNLTVALTVGTPACHFSGGIHLMSHMDPAEIEFLAENNHVQILPNFTRDKIYLISGELGPFLAGFPVSVPIWLAVMFKQKQKCKIVAPEWMELTLLEEIKEKEKNIKLFTKMPSEHYLVEAKLILNCACEDIPQSDKIRTIIKDIWDIRMAKLRTSMDALIKAGGNYGRLDHLTMMEINSAKPLLPLAMDHLYRLQKNAQKSATASGSNLSSSYANISSLSSH